MKLETAEHTARVVAYFCQKIAYPKAKQILPGMLAELSKSPKMTICPQGLTGIPRIAHLVAGEMRPELAPKPVVAASGQSSGYNEFDIILDRSFSLSLSLSPPRPPSLPSTASLL